MHHAGLGYAPNSDAIAALPWVDQLCPLMRHQYAVVRKSPAWAWYALDATVRDSPDSYLAYFRGYQRPNRYWDGTGRPALLAHPLRVQPMHRG